VNAAAARIFSNHEGVKIYQALTTPRATSVSQKKMEKEWTIANYLGKIPSKSKRSKYGAVDADGDFAETSFRVIVEYRRGMWVEAIPRTGRTHQIRVHLSEYGLPILGDDLYGTPVSTRGSVGLATRVMLHAAQLIFPHPISRREIRVESPLPRDFAECLKRLKKD
jgi:23S rRNA-/tRNA-specific pseudouridylate synthase